MMNKLILFLLFFTSLSCWAKFDLSLGVQGRTYPMLGAMAVAESGYNWVFWDKRSGDKKDMWKFGLIRPYVNAASSVVINRIGAGVDFYPVSLLGIGAGRSYDEADFEFRFFDCNITSCDNSYQRDYTRYKLVLGLKNFVLFGIYKYESITPSENSKPFGEYTHIIRGNANYDRLETLQGFFGYQFGERMLGLLYLHAETKRLRENSDGYYLMYQMPQWNMKLNLALGAFRSTIQGEGVGFLFMLNKDIFKGEKLL